MGDFEAATLKWSRSHLNRDFWPSLKPWFAYNGERIHGSIGDITPVEALDKYKRGDLLNIKTITM
jgi:hypothetical protein